MAKKTNKTSHVLNLITNGAVSEPETDNSPESAPAQEGTGNSSRVQQPSDAAAVLEASATGEHAAALRENAAALRESAAALRAVVTTAEGADKEAALASDAVTDREAALASDAVTDRDAALASDAVTDRDAALASDAVTDRDAARASGTPGDKEAALASGALADKDAACVSDARAAKDAALASGALADKDAARASDASAGVKDTQDVLQEKVSAPAEPAADIKDAAVIPQPIPVPSGDKKVIVVNKSGENDKISNEILNQLTNQLEEELKAKNLAEEAKAGNLEAMTGNPGSEAENLGSNADNPGSGTENLGSNADNPGSGTENLGSNAENPGTNAENPGTNAENPGTNAENPGTNAENPGTNAENPEAKPEVYRMVNVMEYILDHTNLEKEMKNYDVCTCSRCRADVMALTLTRLPAKYVVVDESSVAPIIGFYENKYKVRVLTEVIKACMDVRETPRHGSTAMTQYVKS